MFELSRSPINWGLQQSCNNDILNILHSGDKDRAKRAPREIIVSGHTLTYPSLYLELMGTASVIDDCGSLGELATSRFVAVAPGDLFTMTGSVSMGDQYIPDGYGYGNISGPTLYPQKINTVDLACPTFGVGKGISSDRFGTAQITTFGSPYLPLISPPPELLNANSAWRNLCGNKLYPPDFRPFALFDPPHGYPIYTSLLSNVKQASPNGPPDPGFSNSAPPAAAAKQRANEMVPQTLGPSLPSPSPSQDSTTNDDPTPVNSSNNPDAAEAVNSPAPGSEANPDLQSQDPSSANNDPTPVDSSNNPDPVGAGNSPAPGSKAYPDPQSQDPSSGEDFSRTFFRTTSQGDTGDHGDTHGSDTKAADKEPEGSVASSDKSAEGGPNSAQADPGDGGSVGSTSGGSGGGIIGSEDLGSGGSSSGGSGSGGSSSGGGSTSSGGSSSGGGSTSSGGGSTSSGGSSSGGSGSGGSSSGGSGGGGSGGGDAGTNSAVSDRLGATGGGESGSGGPAANTPGGNTSGENSSGGDGIGKSSSGGSDDRPNAADTSNAGLAKGDLGVPISGDSGSFDNKFFGDSNSESKPASQKTSPGFNQDDDQVSAGGTNLQTPTGEKGAGDTAPSTGDASLPASGGSAVSLDKQGNLYVNKKKIDTTSGEPVTLGGETFTPNPSGFTVGGQTVSPGGPAITLPAQSTPGTSVSLDKQGNLYINNRKTALPPPGQVITIAGQTFTPNPNGFKIGTQVITPGGAAATLTSNDLVTAPSNPNASVDLFNPTSPPPPPPPPPSSSPQQSASPSPTPFTLAGKTFTPLVGTNADGEPSAVKSGNVTVSAGGPAVTVDGTSVSLDAKGTLTVGGESTAVNGASVTDGGGGGGGGGVGGETVSGVGRGYSREFGGTGGWRGVMWVVVVAVVVSWGWGWG
ncbi:uncharacterized protein KY384_004639 [Bacidia gigantensis]|uniref:uncharacterized protein n=1 Tax=Bacidia gigantensis TaxID=2732470 RepID=UPI001D03A25A|nr:uncharacterized protein KY384_004639 [Bacidia gigantensis]KAG8530601.1 hypothetical protein KY384_004639 [Bacidia gigantensis]